MNHYMEATEGEGIWSGNLHQGTLPKVAKLLCQGGKSTGRERRPQPHPTRVGKRELQLISSSDSKWMGTSVTEPNPLKYKSSPRGA